jgi:hypothetical protein
MHPSRISRDRQQRFLKALAKTGHPAAATGAAGVDQARIEELRASDPEFGKQWETAEKLFDEMLDYEAHRRAVSGVQEPLISDGKIVHDDAGRPVALSRPSDLLLLILLIARYPEKYAINLRPLLPTWSTWLAASFVIAIIIWVVGDLALRLTRYAF